MNKIMHKFQHWSLQVDNIHNKITNRLLISLFFYISLHHVKRKVFINTLLHINNDKFKAWLKSVFLVFCFIGFIGVFNVTFNNISVTYVTASAGDLKKVDLRSGFNRHRHFGGFLNVPSQHRFCFIGIRNSSLRIQSLLSAGKKSISVQLHMSIHRWCIVN